MRKNIVAIASIMAVYLNRYALFGWPIWFITMMAAMSLNIGSMILFRGRKMAWGTNDV